MAAAAAAAASSTAPFAINTTEKSADESNANFVKCLPVGRKLKTAELIKISVAEGSESLMIVFSLVTDKLVMEMKALPKCSGCYMDVLTPCILHIGSTWKQFYSCDTPDCLKKSKAALIEAQVKASEEVERERNRAPVVTPPGGWPRESLRHGF